MIKALAKRPMFFPYLCGGMLMREGGEVIAEKCIT